MVVKFKLFENVDSIEIGDFVRLVVDELEIGGYDVSTEKDNIIFKVFDCDLEFDEILIESYYYFTELRNDLRLTVYSNEIEKISKEDIETFIDAKKYNL